MRCAAATFVYNESVNLPIWVEYYGRQFGTENLFVIDRSTNDGSTSNLGDVNVIKIRRDPFDEHSKTKLMSSFHSSLIAVYDAVVMTDCDEILVADPGKYSGLVDFASKMKSEYVNGVGIDIIHLLTEELPIDLARPILAQRSFGRLSSPECKQLLSKISMSWLPGLHSSDKPPLFDSELLVFHLKLMDYACAVARQKINIETVWSSDSLEKNYGSHHRYSIAQFFHQSFLVPIDLINRGLISDFEVSKEINEILERTVRDEQGYYRIPMDVSKMVRLPASFRGAF